MILFFINLNPKPETLLLFSMILFFITTNDSGSIILDLIGTSGKTNSSPVQKQVNPKLFCTAFEIKKRDY